LSMTGLQPLVAVITLPKQDTFKNLVLKVSCSYKIFITPCSYSVILIHN
jgi:hypothetical protein